MEFTTPHTSKSGRRSASVQKYDRLPTNNVPAGIKTSQSTPQIGGVKRTRRETGKGCMNAVKQGNGAVFHSDVSQQDTEVVFTAVQRWCKLTGREKTHRNNGLRCCSASLSIAQRRVCVCTATLLASLCAVCERW